MATAKGRLVTNEATGEKGWFDYATGVVTPTTGREADLSASLSSQERKELTDLHTATGNARKAATMAGEFMQGNAKVKTGGLMGLPLVSEAIGAFDPKVSTMQGLANRMIPSMHVTPGPMTDADAKMYKSAIPNPNHPEETNRNLTRAIYDQRTEYAAKTAFYDRYAKRMGTTRGADAAWGSFWADYQAKGAAPKAPPAPPRPNPRQPPANAPRKAAPAASGVLVYDPATGDFR